MWVIQKADPCQVDQNNDDELLRVPELSKPEPYLRLHISYKFCSLSLVRTLLTPFSVSLAETKNVISFFMDDIFVKYQ